MKETKKPLSSKNRLVGYARVSTHEQVLDLQIDALLAAGVHEDNIWKEHVSGVDAKRPQLDMALVDARAGDVFVVWKLDRFGRNAIEVMERIDILEKRGVEFRSLTETIDTTTAMGKLIFGMHALFAQMERDVMRERSIAGMAAARARGRMPGRESKLSDRQWASIEKAIARGVPIGEIADKYGIHRQTIYRRYPTAKIAALQAERE